MFKNICFLHFSWFPTNCWRLRAKSRNFCEAVSWTASSSFSGLSSCYSERLRNYPEDRKSRNQIGTEPFCPFLGFCRESHHWKLCAVLFLSLLNGCGTHTHTDVSGILRATFCLYPNFNETASWSVHSFSVRFSLAPVIVFLSIRLKSAAYYYSSRELLLIYYYIAA